MSFELGLRASWEILKNASKTFVELLDRLSMAHVILSDARKQQKLEVPFLFPVAFDFEINVLLLLIVTICTSNYVLVSARGRSGLKEVKSW